MGTEKKTIMGLLVYYSFTSTDIHYFRRRCNDVDSNDAKFKPHGRLDMLPVSVLYMYTVFGPFLNLEHIIVK